MPNESQQQATVVLPDAEQLTRYAALADHADKGEPSSNALAALAICEAIHHLRASIYRLDETMIDKLILAFALAMQKHVLPTAAAVSNAANGKAPDCPQCASRMKQRNRKADGKPFWGCSAYPACEGMRPCS